MNKGLLNEWLEICEEATDGPWTAKQSGDETEWRLYAGNDLLGVIGSESDATLITIAPQIKDLILHIQQLEARIASALPLLTSLGKEEP